MSRSFSSDSQSNDSVSTPHESTEILASIWSIQFPKPPKEELIDVVQRHFMAQQLDKLQVIVGFAKAAKRLKMAWIGNELSSICVVKSDCLSPVCVVKSDCLTALPVACLKDCLKRSSEATALDRANAEVALLPIPQDFDLHDRKKQDLASKTISDRDEPMQKKDDFEDEKATCCIEDQLRKMGILNSLITSKQKSKLLSSSFPTIDIEAAVPKTKMRLLCSLWNPVTPGMLFKMCSSMDMLFIGES